MQDAGAYRFDTLFGYVSEQLGSKVQVRVPSYLNKLAALSFKLWVVERLLPALRRDLRPYCVKVAKWLKTRKKPFELELELKQHNALRPLVEVVCDHPNTLVTSLRALVEARCRSRWVKTTVILECQAALAAVTAIVGHLSSVVKS